MTVPHTLFSQFYDHVKDGNLKDIGWLRRWKNKYHQNENYTASFKEERVYYPLLFKKICFYLIVRGKFEDKEFSDEVGLPVNRIRKWGASPQLRIYADDPKTYSAIRSFRSGVKKEYIVSTVIRLYYEAGRQESKSTIRKNLPQFVDTFSGTAAVAASVVSDGCPPPIVNDYDPIMVCFAWAFTYYQEELHRRIAEYHRALMKEELNLDNGSYNEVDYRKHYEKIYSLMQLKQGESWGDRFEAYWKKEMLTNPRFWDIYAPRQNYSKAEIQKGKEKAQRYKEFIIRIRRSYLGIKVFLDSCDRKALRKNTDFNNLPKNKVEQVDDILDYALALFYYYSFSPLGKNGNAFHVASVNEGSYYSYLNGLKVNLKTVRGKNQADKAWKLTKLLRPASLKLENEGAFSRHLRGAEFYSKDFRDILPSEEISPSEKKKIYYLDSPYFLTAGYDIGFSDDDHRDMLELLRKADFKWIFSMQYNPSKRCECTSDSDEAKRKRQQHIIKDYGTYYRGFYSPLRLDKSKRVYISTGNPKENALELYAILFDFEAVKKRWPSVRRPTAEMLVVNFNCLRMIPLHDTAVVLPFLEF